ncbi:MAG: hypothetical protein K6G15_00890 [Desulfovibrio sp.]|nr:hypothetical protein [Desulfovibrio sp.]
MLLRFCSLIVLVFLLSLPSALKAETATDCLRAVGDAMDRADLALFQRKVDVDTLVRQGLDVFVACAQEPQMAQALPPMLALVLSQAAKEDTTGKALKAVLLNEVRAFLLQGVASGAFAGRPSGQSAGQGMLAPLFADASLGRKEIVAIGQAERQGDGWLVPFTLHDVGNGQNYALEGLCEEKEGELRLTKILNLPEIFWQILEEAQSYAE